MAQGLDTRTRSQRCSDWICWFSGTWTFMGIFAVFTAIWVLMNTMGHSIFDKYPFILLNLVFTGIEFYQGPLILMSQNRQNERDKEIRDRQDEIDREAIHTILAEIRSMKGNK